MKLSRTVSYAVQAALLLARSPTREPVPCSRIAAEGNMPERFLLQILRGLVTHGILHSTRGVDGGYTLERAPEEVSLLEIIEAIDGPISTFVPATEGLPTDCTHRLHNALQAVTAKTREQLEAVKLSHLMSSPDKRPSPSAGKGPPAPHFQDDTEPVVPLNGADQENGIS